MSQQSTKSDLVATLDRAHSQLTQRADETTPMSTLAIRGRAAVVVECFRQVVTQQAIAALGVDFVTAAQWLSGYYTQATEGLKQQARPTLLGADGAALSSTPAQLGRVGEALGEMASMWREVAEAAQTYEAALFDSAGTAAPDPSLDVATVPGILRIWTAVTASLVQTVTTWRGGRQEVILLTQVMAQTAREAAVMAAMLGQQGDGSAEPDVSDCKYRGTANQRVCAEEGCGFCRAAERRGDEAV